MSAETETLGWSSDGGYHKRLTVQYPGGELKGVITSSVVPLSELLISRGIDPVTMDRLQYQPGDLVVDRTTGETLEVVRLEVDHGPQEIAGYSATYQVKPVADGKGIDTREQTTRNLIPVKYFYLP